MNILCPECGHEASEHHEIEMSEWFCAASKHNSICHCYESASKLYEAAIRQRDEEIAKARELLEEGKAYAKLCALDGVVSAYGYQDRLETFLEKE